MNDADYKFFEELLYRESGLAITPEKIYLLESRLMPLASRFKIEGLDGIVRKLRETRDPELQRAVVEAMTTNETSFFRDTTPFQRLKEEVLPFFLKARASQKTLRIWSAACSSGQETYSLVMTLKEMGAAFAGWRFDIVATDLSLDILEQAKAGAYSQFEVQRGLPIQLLMKYFSQTGPKWVVKPEMRESITFKSANLLTDIPSLGTFDIIFCRNVLIYFDIPTKAKVFDSMKRALKPDGVLFLGGTESVLGITEAFKTCPEVKGVYLRNDTTFVPARKAAAESASGTATAAVAGKK